MTYTPGQPNVYLAVEVVKGVDRDGNVFICLKEAGGDRYEEYVNSDQLTTIDPMLKGTKVVDKIDPTEYVDRIGALEYGYCSKLIVRPKQTDPKVQALMDKGLSREHAEIAVKELI